MKGSFNQIYFRLFVALFCVTVAAATTIPPSNFTGFGEGGNCPGGGTDGGPGHPTDWDSNEILAWPSDESSSSSSEGIAQKVEK